jgi:hypothetical protein
MLSGKAGMHRFVWDLHYPAPGSVAHEYPISAVYRDTPREPRGPVALPGPYTVKLTVEGGTESRPLVVKIDPRVKTPPAGLVQQFELATAIAELMDLDFAALKEVQSVRAQLIEVKAKVGPGELMDLLSALGQEAEMLEGKNEDRFSGPLRTGREPETLTHLNSDLGVLLREVQATDAAPTAQVVATQRELKQKLNALLGRWSGLRKGGLVALNERLRAGKLAEIKPSSPEM